MVAFFYIMRCHDAPASSHKTLKNKTEAHFTSKWQHVCLLNHKDDSDATTARNAAFVYESI